MNPPSTHRHRPTVGEVLKDIVLRAVLPALLVWAIVVGIGLLIMGPLKELPQEEAITDALASDRTWLWNNITDVSSTGNDTWWTIGSAVVFALILLAVTRRWWTAIVPLLAITLESSIFVTATHVVGRPRPEAAKLDQSPPTSSYPSGHTAAAFALYVSLLLLAREIDRAWLRTVITVACLVIPTAVAFSRLYRGMHHLTDVIVGVLLGLWCAYAAARSIRANQPVGPGLRDRGHDGQRSVS